MIIEKAIHAAVVEHWKTFGLPGTLVATLPNYKAHSQYGLTRGLCDLLVVTPHIGCGFIELKTDKGRVSDHQNAILQILEHCNVPAEVTRGRDEPIALLKAWGAVR